MTNFDIQGAQMTDFRDEKWMENKVRKADAWNQWRCDQRICKPGFYVVGCLHF